MQETDRMRADIVIIGAGGSGLAAALAAAEKGCRRIIVLEKAGVGGNSAMAHDVFGVESPVQRRMGIDARKDDFFRVAMRWSHWSKVNPRIVRAFIDKSGDTIRWLQEKGLGFDLGQYYVNQMPRIMHTIQGEGEELMRVLAAKCRERGIEILTRTPAVKILRDGKGEVTGVVAAGKDEEFTITPKSVIVTTGGYAENKELLKRNACYNPDTMLSHGVRSNSGDGIRMATEIGAATAGIGHIMFHGPSAPPSAATRMKIGDPDTEVKEYPVSIVIREPETLWVNKRGRRFIDEGHNLSSFASATTVAQQPDGIMYTVFDDRIRQSTEEDGINWPAAYGGQVRESPRHKRPLPGAPLPGLGRELKLQADKGVAALKIADSLDEIAEWIGAKPAVLRATVEEYNSCCDKGHDFIFCKDQRWLMPIRTAPFYAVKGQAFICDAIGGIKINERMEVVDHEDNAIPGLFAAGSTTGCWETENYCYELTGHLLGFALNSGRIAGENAAEYTASG